ncbi:metal ABC transporter substrate-binding protein [Streptomyces marincola]|uniref:Zinc ABC transporter substrate-binding protein n=1 Tax=Streptomyces marincola TaxID=2878388 RepID=A0A1W7D1Q5_9ACTN|nr:metal ABC transporter substrate-binding protein [Streptomyces marincola]ARQ70887.1 zinc ABC transporter substrate-binding protein [Streptomyces marincola]
MAVMTARSRSGSRSRISATALAAGVTALGLFAVTGCGSDDGAGETGGGDGLDVVASFYPMAFLAERIGGEHVEVSTLTEPGTDPHDLDIGAQQTARLSEADLVVYLAGLQPAVDEAVEQSGAEHVVEATSLTTLAESGGGEEEHAHDEHEHEHADEEHGHDEHDHADEEHGHDHGDEGHGHDEHDHGDEEHGHDHGDHGHDHDHGGLDPHIWLDPVRYAEVAEGVGAALAEADPDHAADYERNTADLTAELAALDEEFAEGLATTETDTFITTHAAFGYLADRYGLHEESITGLDPESEPSGARMRELQDIAEADNVTTVFFETLISDETARTLANDLGLETAVLDPVEGITAESPGADYLEVMRANLDALREALGAS